MKQFWIFDFGFSIGRFKSRKVFCLALGALLLAFCFPAEAQPQTRIPKVGWLGLRPISDPGGGYEILRQELRALGYVEGKNIVFEYRSADNKSERLPALADELVRLKVDVLVAPAGNEAVAAKNATKTIPIVFASGGDPVAGKLVDSVARPGGNLTGYTAFHRCWPVNDWSCSRKPFPSSPALQCCGIQKI